VNKPSPAPLATFLGLTFALSAVCWWLITRAGSIGANGGVYLLALMWSPGVSALATRFAFRRNRTSDTRRSNVLDWTGLAYVLPLGYATAAYGAVWASGLGAVDLGRLQRSVPEFLVIGALQSLLTATGEELGRRGFLVPALARITSFGRTALVSGAIWAAWHVPLIVLADYNAGTPAWYAVPCFALGVVSLSVGVCMAATPLGQLLAGGDTTHNLFVQGFFDVVTVDTGPTRWLTGEFGAALAAALVVTGWLFWRRRESVRSAFAEI
jgi:membrane protease YdiL (CAAX protease family)